MVLDADAATDALIAQLMAEDNPYYEPDVPVGDDSDEDYYEEPRKQTRTGPYLVRRAVWFCVFSIRGKLPHPYHKSNKHLWCPSIGIHEAFS